PEETTRVRNGLKVSRRDIPQAALIRMYQVSGEFIGLGRLSSDHMLAPKRMMRTN
ncbi:MAG: tRNA pseudouridine(55) synthase TruB, partial [Cocleimonas sp.]|nr:tRNA pseudouridine(55) synthase TruB [Cocleimonas sp.]